MGKEVKDDLGKRMKEFYEQIPNIKLIRRLPVIIRIDGKAFHSFTKGFKKPFDNILIETMQETTKYLCENIQGCVLGYTQSDEISLLLIDYKKLNSSSWFDYKTQKICSISASMTTMIFNKFLNNNIERYLPRLLEEEMYYCCLKNSVKKGAMFDARVFNIPKEEVTNYFYWRQLDAIRNSIQMVGQANFSHKILQNKSNNEIQNMLITQKNINWNNYPIYQKRGTCIIKKYDKDSDINIWNSRWFIDKEIPIFKGEDRNYINQLVYVGE